MWLFVELVSTYQAMWNLSKYLRVDESMVGYNGKYCSFKQFMPAKPMMHEIKLWALECVVTKIVLRLEVYVEACNEAILHLLVHACGSGARVVTSLTSGMEHNHYTVVMDNFFTGPLLFDNLLKRGFYAIGTI